MGQFGQASLTLCIDCALQGAIKAAHGVPSPRDVAVLANDVRVRNALRRERRVRLAVDAVEIRTRRTRKMACRVDEVRSTSDLILSLSPSDRLTIGKK